MVAFLKTYKPYLLFLGKFLGLYCIFNYGILSVLALSSPSGFYSSFVAENLNFINSFGNILFLITQSLLSILGYVSFLESETVLRIQGGAAIRILYSCMGFAVLSFWTAFVLANSGTFKTKFSWIVTGIVIICLINVLRFSVLLIALNAKSPMPLGIEHHTWFNIMSYGLIFLMIYLYDRSGGGKVVGNKL